MAEPRAGDVDGDGLDDIVVQWREAEGTSDSVDHITAFGSSGRLWSVAISPDGMHPE